MSENNEWLQDAIYYIRVNSGMVYSSQVVEYLISKYGHKEKLKENQLILELNKYLEAHNCMPLSIDKMTGQIFTQPYARKDIDLEICKGSYKYNEYLYKNHFEIDNIVGYKEINNNEIVDECVERDNDNIHFNFEKLNSKYNKYYIKDFDLYSLIEKVSDKYKLASIIQINGIKANNMIFKGNTNFIISSNAKITVKICGSIEMENSTFEGDFTMQGLEFIFGENTIIDFRNSCFFGDVRIRNIRFKESNLNNKFSLEDARIHKNLEIFNCNFGHVNLYCFQLVMGEFSNGEIGDEKTVKIINTYFEDDAKIDFTDMELNHGKIIIKNIEHMPVAKLCMSPYLKKNKEKVCPNVTVEIIKCGIYNTLTLSNISQLTFGHSQNYSHVICDDNWVYKDNDISKRRHKANSEKCYAIKNKALIAIINYKNTDLVNTTNIQNITGLQKAEDCIMLKENFSNMGMYTEEDEAFILYMKYRPIVDSRQKGVEENKIKPMISHTVLYKLLYIIGKYGISPLRVIYSLIVVICAFTIVYGIWMYIVLNKNVYDAVTLYSLGKVMIPENNIGSIAIGAFLYSLANIVPFVCQFEPFKVSLCIISAIENLIGTFLIGYFSVAVVRKTLR